MDALAGSILSNDFRFLQNSRFMGLRFWIFTHEVLLILGFSLALPTVTYTPFSAKQEELQMLQMG